MDGELLPRQDDRIESLVTRTSFTRDEASRIIEFADADPSEQCKEILLPDSANTYGDAVSEVECACIRRDMADASTAREAIEAHPNLSASAIFAHAKGRCDHDEDDVGESTTLSPRISKDECRRMKDDFAQKGKTVNEIKASTYRSTNAVLNHVFGDCTHDHESRGSHLSDEERGKLVSAYQETPTRTQREVASAFRVSINTVHRHVQNQRRNESH